MYSFVDTIEYSRGKGSLPAEAVSLNDKYIENEIEGYRTLHVVGRELLESEIIERQIGNEDGAQFQGKRNTTRVITVTYSLTAKTPEEFRDKFNKLSLILDQEQAKIVFYDEPDKYFIGTKSSVEAVPEGLLNVVSSFDIYCADPYKYSVVEKTFQAAPNSEGVLEAVIVNNGTKAVPVDYTIRHNHENGYIGIVSEHGVIQLGSPDEVDRVKRSKSQLLIEYRNPTAFSAMTDKQGILATDYPKDGSFKNVTVNGKQWLAIDRISSGESWHGAAKIVDIPEDSGGSVGATEFYAQAKIWFETGKVEQTGLAEFSIADESGQHLASIKIAKYDLTRNIAYAIFCIQGKEMLRYGFRPDKQGVTTYEKGQVYIKKSAELFEFYFGGGKWQYRVPAAQNKKATTMSIFLGQHGTRGGVNLVSRMYFDYIFFQKNNVIDWYDIPNRFRKGSTVYVDGNATKVYVDGIISMEDETLGSKYFRVPPGETKVQFYNSDFSVPEPTVTAKIREAYL